MMQFKDEEIASMLQWQYRNGYVIPMVFYERHPVVGMCISEQAFEENQDVLYCMEWYGKIKHCHKEVD